MGGFSYYDTYSNKSLASSFFRRILQIQHADFHGLRSKTDLNNVADFYIHGSLRRFAVDHHTTGVTSFIRHCASLDQPGHF